VHRVFYGIASIVLGIVSFPASNLGGFFIGMLLAIIGGSIGFAWTPVEPDRAATVSPADENPADESPVNESAANGSAEPAAQP
jgi:Family of unknown function (DUF6114)